MSDKNNSLTQVFEESRLQHWPLRLFNLQAVSIAEAGESH